MGMSGTESPKRIVRGGEIMGNIHGNVRGRKSEENCPGWRNYGEYPWKCPGEKVLRKLSEVEKLWGISMGMSGGESPKKIVRGEKCEDEKCPDPLDLCHSG